MARRSPEHTIQVGVVRLAAMCQTQYPALGLLHAIPNGAHLPRRQKNGRVYCPEMNWLKAEGLKPGMPDLHLPVPMGGYVSLYMETKVPGAYPTREQQKIHALLREHGNRVEVYRAIDEGWEILLGYLTGQVMQEVAYG